jgi:hypothetical protein
VTENTHYYFEMTSNRDANLKTLFDVHQYSNNDMPNGFHGESSDILLR